MGSRKKYIRYAVVILALLLIIPAAERSVSHMVVEMKGFEGSEVRASIALDSFGKATKNLSTGYNYELLRLFAKDIGFTVDVSVPDRDDSPLDSLRNGALDLLVLPLSDSLDTSGLLLSSPVEGNTVWAVREEGHRRMREINSWLGLHLTSREGKELKNRFFRMYNPRNLVSIGRSSSTASPYDRTFKECASTLGWDWRLLAAVAWHESQYRIQARSPRGARGIMQMIPKTAERFGVKDVLDPQENIKAGTAYLASLQRMFEGIAPDRDSLMKLTLAAYNVGEGKLLSRLEDSLQTGPSGKAYVDSVLACYACLKIVCPQGYETVAATVNEPSAQDPPLTQTDTVSTGGA